jgi:putative transposase
MDETTMSLHPPLRRCWMKRGQRKTIPAPGTPAYRHVFGALNWYTTQVSHLITTHKNTDAFIAFLEHLLLTCYPHDRVILVLDNASFHKSRAALAALDAFAHRLQVVWLPTYSPYFNPIERFWLHLKNLASANRLHTGLADLCAAIDLTIADHNLVSNPNRLSFAHYFRLTA